MAPGGGDDGARHAGQSSDLQPVAAAGGAVLHAVQKDQRLAVLGDLQVHVGHPGEALRQLGQLEVVRREQGEGADARGQILGAGARQREAVVGAGAAADLVHQHQTAGRGVVQDVGGFGHLHHEGRAPGGQLVGGADAGKDAVHGADARGAGGHVAAHVGEQHDQRNLAHVGRFAAHVGAGDDEQAPVRVEAQIVWDEGLVQRVFDHGMAARLDLEPRLVGQLRLAPVERQRPFGEAGEHVQRGDGGHGFLQRSQFAGEFREQGFEERLLPHQRPLARAQHLVLEALQLLGDVALGALERLAPGVLGRNALGVAAPQLDVVAVHTVVAHFERGDTGTLALAPFQVEQKAIGILGQGAQAVEFGVEAGRDRPAVAQQRWGIHDQRPREPVMDRGVVVQRRAQVAEQRAVELRE